MDQSPTALFDSYEQDLQQILGSVREKLEGDAKEGRGGMYYLLSPVIIGILLEK